MGDWTDQGEQKIWEAYSFSYALLTQGKSDGYGPSAEVKSKGMPCIGLQKVCLPTGGKVV